VPMRDPSALDLEVVADAEAALAAVPEGAGVVLLPVLEVIMPDEVLLGPLAEAELETEPETEPEAEPETDPLADVSDTEEEAETEAEADAEAEAEVEVVTTAALASPPETVA
jgi:hypothetical protein